MLRWLACVLVLAAPLSFVGCGGKASEIPAKKESSEPKMTSQDAAQKAMQGMPAEMQKKYQSKR
ncbi:MAG: hypothetical protein NUV77_19970 [Thermoguttaceae bacterium]|jgi:outer membrane PBP1 activator LpoA protein|nr:hypothetical protein [Thermoguttaceae bacterium]